MNEPARTVKSPIRPLAILVAALVWGCGGGGGGESPAPLPNLKPGEFVTTFGSGGIATLGGGALDGATATASFVATDAGSGAIRAAGHASRSLVFARLLSGGMPDARFGGTGYLLGPFDPAVGNIAVDSYRGLLSFARADASEVLVESVSSPCMTGPMCSVSGGRPSVITIARAVDATGVPVTNYGASGATMMFNLDPLQGLVDPSGGVLVLGRSLSGPGGTRRNRLVRLTPQGLPDAEFEANAAAAIDCPGLDPLKAVGAVLARRTDGKLLVAQTFQLGSAQGSSRTCVSRLNPDGTIDGTYGASGYVQLGWEFLWDENAPVAIFALQNGGSALFLQKRREIDGSVQFHYMIAVATSDGALDATRFDRGIVGPTDLHVAKLTAVTMQGDGNFLIAGYPALEDNPPAHLAGRVERYDNSQPRIGRILASGGADLSFGPLGRGYAFLLSFGVRLDPRHVHIAPDRGILVAGAAGTAGPVNDSEATRFAVGKLAGDAAR